MQDAHDNPTEDSQVGIAMKRLYELLHAGDYMDDTGQRKRLNGDISKLHKVIGLSPLQGAIIRNMFFMSAHLAGTRQVRKTIGHLLTAARVAYGIPIFITTTPSERHSGLTCHLTRYRLRDPGIQVGSPELAAVAGYLHPSLMEAETAEAELPDYDLRRLCAQIEILCAPCMPLMSGCEWSFQRCTVCGCVLYVHTVTEVFAHVWINMGVMLRRWAVEQDEQMH